MKTYYITKKQEEKHVRDGFLDRGFLNTANLLSPGWKRAKYHVFKGDHVFELPGHIFVRALDITVG